MNQALKVTQKVKFIREHKARRIKHADEVPPPQTAKPGSVPRVSRLMALAIRFDQLIRDGIVADQADIARLSHVSRARVTQIMNLLLLAPDIQEEILFLPRTMRGRDPIREIHIRPICREIDWDEQRRMWDQVKSRSSLS